jgi:thioredoxin-related protein
VFGGSSSFSIIESMQQVVVDIRMYLLYLLLMMWGFACAYCVLFRRDQEHEVRRLQRCVRGCYVTAVCRLVLPA